MLIALWQVPSMIDITSIDAVVNIINIINEPPIPGEKNLLKSEATPHY